MPCTPMVQSRYEEPSSKSVRRETLRRSINARRYILPLCTHPHSRVSSSRSSIFLKRWSSNALISAYSARPSRIGIASKVPMHPLNRGCRPGRDDLVFQVTKSGLRSVSTHCISYAVHALFLIRKLRCDGFVPRQCAEERIEASETMLLGADGLFLLYEASCWVRRHQRH